MQEPYTVVVIEDEIVSMEHICAIIAQRCTTFRIIAQCADGLSGLRAIREHKPDLAITDIKMPVMNGLDLLSAASGEFPFLATIVISGYQNFDYVKGALTIGSLDYLLKPITPEKLEAVLERVAKRIDDIRLEQRTTLVQSLLKGLDVQAWKMQKYFPDTSYYAGIIRKNGLPRRFHRSYGVGISPGRDDMMTFLGRDEMEKLYLCPGSKISSSLRLKSMISDVVAKGFLDVSGCDYTTVVVVKDAFAITDLCVRVSGLYRTLDSNLIIGCSQIFYDEQVPGVDMSSAVFDRELFARIDYFLYENKFDDFRHEIGTLFEEWRNKRCTQLCVENMVHQIYHHLIKCARKIRNTDTYEFMLDDAFYYASSYNELEESISNIFQQIIRDDYGTFYKVDTPEFFAAVDEYINVHFAESLSLQGCCTVFGISQTYMSRLFRKYTKYSFTGYVKIIRIEKAKKLMREEHSLRIKDIATMVGIKDQFYFSRLFHSVVGMTPSEYVTRYTDAVD